MLGIGDGSLSPERFELWVRQDYLFLVEYARLLALACARAPELDTMRRFAELARSVLEVEMELHRSYCGRLGITLEVLEREQMRPTTQGYTDFLVRTAAVGDFAEVLAALLPCMWGYSEIGERLARAGKPGVERYDEWIEMYADEEFARLAGWCREVTDRACAHLGPAELARVERAFLTSSRYELAFWEMAWTGEAWPGRARDQYYPSAD